MCRSGIRFNHKTFPWPKGYPLDTKTLLDRVITLSFNGSPLRRANVKWEPSSGSAHLTRTQMFPSDAGKVCRTVKALNQVTCLAQWLPIKLQKLPIFNNAFVSISSLLSNWSPRHHPTLIEILLPVQLISPAVRDLLVQIRFANPVKGSSSRLMTSRCPPSGAPRIP